MTAKAQSGAALAADLQDLIAGLRTKQTAPSTTPVTPASEAELKAGGDADAGAGESSSVPPPSSVAAAAPIPPVASPQPTPSTRPRTAVSSQRPKLAVSPPDESQAVGQTELPSVRTRRDVGKRSDPEYMQMGAYVRRSTVLAVKRRLLDRDEDLSDLLETLLSDWVRTH